MWNLFAQIADDQTRQEILDWYHLKENLYKVQASKKFLEQIEADLWQGYGEEVISQLRKTQYVGVTNFIGYLRKHRHRLVNYMYFQAEQLSSIGSGAVESAVKQIDKRLQIVGAQWKSQNLPQMLQLLSIADCPPAIKVDELAYLVFLVPSGRIVRCPWVLSLLLSQTRFHSLWLVYRCKMRWVFQPSLLYQKPS